MAMSEEEKRAARNAAARKWYAAHKAKKNKVTVKPAAKKISEKKSVAKQSSMTKNAEVIENKPKADEIPINPLNMLTIDSLNMITDEVTNESDEEEYLDDLDKIHQEDDDMYNGRNDIWTEYQEMGVGEDDWN